MDSHEGKQAGDIVSSKKSSAKDEYYRYMLLKEKLAAAADDAADPLLTVQSEREAIEINILRKLINITESSPEFSQIVDITGSRDRYEQARILAEVVYDKVRAETILSFYTPDRDKMKSYFADATRQSVKVRANALDEAKIKPLSVTSGVSGAATAATSLTALKRFASGANHLG